VLRVDSDGTAGNPVSLGTFTNEAIAVDPGNGTVYAAAQNGFGQPQIFASIDHGGTFGAGPALPALPQASLLNGLAANNGNVLFGFSAAGSEQFIFSSGGGAFGSATTAFTESNGGFTPDGLGSLDFTNVHFWVLDTPNGGSTSLINVALPFGGGSPSPTTLASSSVGPIAVGGGSQSNGDVAWGFSLTNVINLAQLEHGSNTPSTLDTGIPGKTQASVVLNNGVALVVGLAGSNTPSTLFGTACFSKLPMARIERGRGVGSKGQKKAHREAEGAKPRAALSVPPKPAVS